MKLDVEKQISLSNIWMCSTCGNKTWIETSSTNRRQIQRIRPRMKTLESFSQGGSFWTEVEKAGCGSIQRYAQCFIHNSICHGNKGNHKWLKFNVLPIMQPGRGTRRASGRSKGAVSCCTFIRSAAGGKRRLRGTSWTGNRHHFCFAPHRREVMA